MDVRRRIRRISATAALTMIAAPLLAVVVPSPGAVGAETYPLHVLGELPAVKGPNKKAGSQHTVLTVDAKNRRLFLLHVGSDLKSYVVTYDIRPRMPRQVGIGEVGTPQEYPYSDPYTATADTKRANLALLTIATDVQGHRDDGLGKLGNVVIYSQTQNKVVARWRMADQVPGFFPMGVTYSEADDRYYFVGDLSANSYVADGTTYGGAKPVSPVAAVVALNAQDGKLAWVRPVPQCQMVLFSKNIGALVARSEMRDAIYFTCVSGGSPGGQTYPGQSGLVRLSISRQGDTSAAASWPVEFFAISGNYYAGGTASGIAAFDASTDRFYVQSISFKTPGAWVFDGRLSGWVGFVAADVPKNYYIGVNPGLSHLYMGITGSNGADGLIVSDVRQTPVPAGEKSKLVTTSLIATDPKSNRMFVRPLDFNAPYLVVEDLMPVTKADVENDYDAETMDLPDTPANDVFFAAGATGYGAQAVQVGGGDAPLTAGGPTTSGWPAGVKRVGHNTRAIMAARVGYLDLRNEGASASAQAATTDHHTKADYEQDYGEDEGVKDYEPQDWPYALGSCLDAGGEPQTKTEQDYAKDPASGEYAKDDTGAGTFKVHCDVSKKVASATTRLGPSGNGATYIDGATYTADAGRTVAKGAVVTTTAVARGASFALTGGYGLRIGRAVSVATSEAHGRPNTAKSSWSREITSIEVRDSTDKVVFSTPGCASKIRVVGGKVVEQTDTCRPLAKTLNELLQTRFRIEFPLPNVLATPKGAFAGVEQSAAEYYTQSVVNEQGVVYPADSIGRRPAPAVVTEVYNDTAERSRTITALAATQANAVFTVRPPYQDGWVPPVPGDEEPDVVVPDLPIPKPGFTAPTGGAPGITPPVTGPAPTHALPVADVSGFLFLRRSVRDMILLVLLAGLMASGAAAAARRRRLVDVLTTVPGKEATP